MKKQKQLTVWYTILVLVFALFTFSLIPTANAAVIYFQEQYQDYTGAFHPYTSDNLAKYPLYIIIDNGNTYTVSRIDDSIEFIKQNTTYSFENNKISFTLNLTPQQLNSRSIQDGANWYINIPKPLTSKRFTWDFKKPVVTNNTGYEIPNNNFWFTNANGQPRLYYNQAARNVGALSTYIKFEFNSFIISNVTSAGWADANITLNGSRFTDNGKLAINLRNDSSLNMTNLTAYWSLDEENGLILHNVNNESGLANSTNQGTWLGTILNSTGAVVGNGTEFKNELISHIDAGTDPSVDITSTNSKGITISAWTYFNTVSGSMATNLDAANGYEFGTRNANLLVFFTSTATFISSSTSVDTGKWYLLTATYDGTTASIYINGSLDNSGVLGGISSSVNPLKLGFGSFWTGTALDGRLDEVKIWNRALSASEISVLYNTSLRTKGNVTIWKQNSTSGYIIDRVRLIINNSQVHNNTVNIYTKPNSSTVWNLTAVNISNNTWYNIDTDNQSTSQDFLVAMSGNGSDTPFFTSLEWDETLIPVATPSISCANAYRDINSAFQLIGILLILFAAMMIIIGIQNYNNPSYLIMGATSGVIGTVMLAVGVFIVITVGTGAGCV